MSEHPKYNVVAVGDSGVGKSCLLLDVYDGELSNGRRQMDRVLWTRVDEKLVGLRLVGTTVHEEARRKAYISNADVILLCFSIDEPASLESIQYRWLPEVLYLRRHHPIVSYLLVGCKMDLRTTPDPAPDRYRHLRYRAVRQLVPPEAAEKVARIIGAEEYIECSAVSRMGMKEVYDAAARAVVGSS
ncbi:GTP-binding protein Rho1 [Serendipita sp. 399]|nr:GTP-binding protein Rho1 [Serendipita sp. 399]